MAPIRKDGNGVIQYTLPKAYRQAEETGVSLDCDWAVADEFNIVKQVKFDVVPTTTGPGVLTLRVDVAGDTTIDLTNGSDNTPTFKTIQPDHGTSPVAITNTDTLILTSSDNSITITGNSSTDTIDFIGATGSLTNTHIFVGNASNIAVDVALSGDATITNTGVLTIANSAITNAKIANGTINLTTKVTGALPVANGGTSLATLTANNVILGNGTSAPLFVAPGTSGNILTSNGTTWTSGSAPTSGINQLTGDVTAGPGTGSQVAMIANLAVTNAKIANATIDLTTKVTGVLPIANGGTNMGSALNNNRVMQSSGGSIVEAAAITAARALISDSNGIPIQSAVTSTELGYVSGVTSSIQTQLNAKASSTLTDTHIFVGNGSNVATDVAVSGDLTLADTGAFTIANLAVTNAKIANSTINLTTKVTGVLPVANGGTNSSAALNNNRIIISSSGAVVETAAITANRALKSDANGLPVASTATAANLDALSGTNTGDVTLAAFGSTPNANGASLSGQVLNLQPADATNPGGVSTGTQTIAGAKTFTGNTLIANNAGSQATIGGTSSTAVHVINGGIRGSIRTVTANLTVDTTTTDSIIFADTSGGAFNITLPAPTSGRILYIKDVTGSFNTNNLTVVRNGSEKIEGLAASKLLTTNWGSWNITSNGTDWFFI